MTRSPRRFRRSLLYRLLLAACVAAPVSAPASARAGGTRTVELSSFDDFDGGETEGAAIESSGKITVGFVAERTEVPGALAFSCLGRDDDVLVGTADAASIQRVSFVKRGRDKGTAKVEPLAALDGVVVTAMAALPGGDVIAATLPGGKIMRIGPRGAVSTFAELPVEQIWALLVHDGRVLAATGPSGELLSLSLSGKDPKVVLDSDDKHLLSIARVGEHVVVGTSPGAKILQVSDAPEGVLVHDFAGDEVRAIAVTRTGLLAAVNHFSDRQLSSVDALTKALERTSLVGQPPSGTTSGGSPPKADGAVHHVDLGKGRDLLRASEARWETWLSRNGQYFTSLLALDDVGTVLVGTSAEGKVYRLRGPRTVATIADFEERQTTALCRAGDGPILATTGHAAAAYRLLGATARSARWRTDVIAAPQPSTYGAFVVHAAGQVTARARVGASEEPDGRWTDWTAIPLSRRAGALRGTLAALPHRRYLQVELELVRPDTEVRSVELFYAPENLPPLLRGVDVQRPSFQSSDDDEPSSEVTIKWDADARDDDDLVYDVRLRPEGGSDLDWVPLHGQAERITKRELKWDLATVPDGVYEIEVIASDEPSNGSGSALQDGLRSDPVVVDHGRPDIADVKVTGRRVTARATDAVTRIHDVAFSIDGGDFAPATAQDGLFDTEDEAVALEIPTAIPAGRHRLVLRARDAFGNLRTVALFVDV